MNRFAYIRISSCDMFGRNNGGTKASFIHCCILPKRKSPFEDHNAGYRWPNLNLHQAYLEFKVKYNTVSWMSRQSIEALTREQLTRACALARLVDADSRQLPSPPSADESAILFERGCEVSSHVVVCYCGISDGQKKGKRSKERKYFWNVFNGPGHFSCSRTDFRMDTFSSIVFFFEKCFICFIKGLDVRLG